MLNNVKLGVKIGIQLAVLLIIMAALGITAAFIMKNVSGDSVILKKEHIPAVQISSNMERAIMLTMYSMRGYWISEKKQYYDEALNHLETVKKCIREAQELTKDSLHLAEFKNAVINIEQLVAIYEKMVAETAEKTGEVNQSRKILEESAATFLNLCNIQIDFQQDVMEAEIVAGIETDKLNNRLSKIIDFTDVIVLLDETRVAVFKFQILRDPSSLKDARKNFVRMDEIFQNILTTTLRGKIRKQIEDINLAANTYRDAMDKLIENQTALDALNEKRIEIVGKVQEQAKLIMTTGMEKTEKTSEQTVASLSKAYKIIIIGLVVCVLIGIGVAFIITHGITAPIRKAVEITNAIAQGDMTQKLDIHANNEIGTLAASLNRATDDLSSMLIQIKDNSVTLAGASEELSTISGQLASSSEQTSTGVNAMASAVEEMSVNAQSVSSTAEQMSSIMNSIASAMEEMSVSVKNIAQTSREGANISGKAIKISEVATSTINALGEAAGEIGDVTEMIKQIAQQTNLLALNATIEAASAGDAGRGFAVVANEIKELAGQSGKAAENIAKRISGVQTSVKETVHAIADVSGIIAKMNESSIVITRSVEQQTLASNEISSNVQQANDGARTIASSIAEIAKGNTDIAKNAAEAAKSVNQMSSGAHQIKISSNDLSKIAGQLQGMITKFKV